MYGANTNNKSIVDMFHNFVTHVFNLILLLLPNNGSFLIINQGTSGKAKSCDNFGSTRIYLGDYEKILEYYGGYSTELLINS